MEMLREEVRRRSTPRYSNVCWRVEPKDRERFGEKFRLNKTELDWVFNSCYGVYAPIAVCATYNQTPFIYQNAAKHLWPIDEGFAEYAKGCCYVIHVGELEDAMRYSLKTIGPDRRIDNVLGAKQFRGHSFLMRLFVPIKSLTAHGAYATQTGAIVTKTKVPRGCDASVLCPGDSVGV